MLRREVDDEILVAFKPCPVHDGQIRITFARQPGGDSVHGLVSHARSCTLRRLNLIPFTEGRPFAKQFHRRCSHHHLSVKLFRGVYKNLQRCAYEVEAQACRLLSSGPAHPAALFPDGLAGQSAPPVTNASSRAPGLWWGFQDRS